MALMTPRRRTVHTARFTYNPPLILATVKCRPPPPLLYTLIRNRLLQTPIRMTHHRYHHHRIRTYWNTCLFLICISHFFVHSFVIPSSSIQRVSSSSFILSAVIPTLDEWEITKQGGIRGIVTNHPDSNILDGECIATSPLKSREQLKPGIIVTTQSGSQYKLGTLPSSSLTEATPLKEVNRFANPLQALFPNSFKNSSGGSKSLNTPKPQTVSNTANTNNNNNPPLSSTPAQWEKYGLSGITIGNGRYLLGSTPKKSTSGKSTLWPAYRNVNPSFIPTLTSMDLNNKIQPTGNALCVKISPYYDILQREDENYNRVMKKSFFQGRFVQKFDFLPSIQVYDASPSSSRKKTFLPELNSDLCGLVMEAGWIDLKSFLQRNNKSSTTTSPLSFFSSIQNKNKNMISGQGLPRRALRNAAMAAAQCLQALHGSGLVWTDLKTENFVLIKQDGEGKEDMGQVKGIDLESAVNRGSSPTDFSPEACPPEFASAFITGKALTFQVDYSYDIWSYGMLLYELSTGQGYFGTKSPTQMTKFLAQLSQEKDRGSSWMDLSLIQDEKLKDLIGQCVALDPSRRPSNLKIRLHPYFLTTGVGPYSF